MIGLDEYARLGLAVELLCRNARVPIVRSLTDLPRAVVRRMHREIHGESAHSGQLPTTAAVMSTRVRHVQVSLWVCLYAGLGGAGVYRVVNPRALIDACDTYTQVLRAQGQDPVLDINDAWVIARDLRTRAARLRSCPRCQVRYLVCEDSRVPPSCPICALRARGARPARAPAEGSRGAAVVPRPAPLDPRTRTDGSHGAVTWESSCERHAAEPASSASEFKARSSAGN